MGGIHWDIGLSFKRLGTLAANVPAIINGIICPNPKEASKNKPVKGFPVFAIHASRTAKTGVEQGEEASPNAKPAEIGAIAGGNFFCHVLGSGPAGNEILNTPNKFSPIKIATRATALGKKNGN